MIVLVVLAAVFQARSHGVFLSASEMTQYKEFEMTREAYGREGVDVVYASRGDRSSGRQSLRPVSSLSEPTP